MKRPTRAAVEAVAGMMGFDRWTWDSDGWVDLPSGSIWAPWCDEEPEYVGQAHAMLDAWEHGGRWRSYQFWSHHAFHVQMELTLMDGKISREVVAFARSLPFAEAAWQAVCAALGVEPWEEVSDGK